MKITTFIQEGVRYFQCDDHKNVFTCFKNGREWILCGSLENFSLTDFEEDGKIKNALDRFVRKEKLEKLLS